MSLDVYLTISVDTGGVASREIELYSANITHNLGKMAAEAGIYSHLWHPEDIGAVFAKDIIHDVEVGLNDMKHDPERYKKFNSPNGWGMYKNFVPWIEKYLNACKEHPKAIINVSR